MKPIYWLLTTLSTLFIFSDGFAKNLFSKKDNGFIFVFIENDCGACNVMAASAVGHLKTMNVEYKSIVVAENKRIYNDFVDYGLPEVVKKKPVSYFPLNKLKEKLRSDLYFVENGKVVYSYYSNQDLITLYKPFLTTNDKNFVLPQRLNLSNQFYFKIIQDSLLFYNSGEYQSFYGLLSLKTGFDYKEKIIKEAKEKFLSDTSSGVSFVFIKPTSSIDSGVFHFFGYTSLNNIRQNFIVKYKPQTNEFIFNKSTGLLKVNNVYDFSLNTPIQVRNGNYFYNTTLGVEEMKTFFSNNKFLPSYLKLKNGDVQSLSFEGKMPEYYLKNFGYINNWKDNFENQGLGLFTYKRFPAILDTNGNTIRLNWEIINNEDNVKYQDWAIEDALNYKNYFLLLVRKNFQMYLAVFNTKGELICSRHLKVTSSILSFSNDNLYEFIPIDLGLKNITLRKLPLY